MTVADYKRHLTGKNRGSNKKSCSNCASLLEVSGGTQRTFDVQVLRSIGYQIGDAMFTAVSGKLWNKVCDMERIVCRAAADKQTQSS